MEDPIDADKYFADNDHNNDDCVNEYNWNDLIDDSNVFLSLSILSEIGIYFGPKKTLSLELRKFRRSNFTKPHI